MLDVAALVAHDAANYGGPPTLAAAYTQVFSKAFPYAIGFVAVWFLFDNIFKLAGCGPEIKGVARGTWALKSAMLVHHSFVTPVSLIGIWQDKTIMTMYTCLGCSSVAPLMNRDSIPCITAGALTPITLGYFIGDLLLLRQWNLKASGRFENLLMLFHHITSLAVWPAAVYFDWVSRYVLIMLSYEFTSLWLTVMWMLSAAGLKNSKWYLISGGIFTLSFVIMRMVGAIPQLVALYHAQPWSEANERAAAGPAGIHPWCWIFSASLVLPHLLNFFWGFKVVKGFLSVFFKPSKNKAP